MNPLDMLQFRSDETGGIALRHVPSTVDRRETGDTFEVLVVRPRHSADVGRDDRHQNVSASDAEESAGLPAAGGHRLPQRSRTHR